MQPQESANATEPEGEYSSHPWTVWTEPALRTRFASLYCRLLDDHFRQTLEHLNRKRPMTLQLMCLKSMKPWINDKNRKFSDVLRLELPCLVTLELLVEKRDAFFSDVSVSYKRFSFAHACLSLTEKRRAYLNEALCIDCFECLPEMCDGDSNEYHTCCGYNPLTQ